MGLLLATISCALALGPCAGTAPTAASPAARFTISYERSGGLAAMPQKLVIRPGRRATVTALDAHGRRRSVEFSITAKKVEQLRAAAETARIGDVAPSPPSGCADCFVYSVTYRGETASVAEVDVPARMRGLVSRAEALIAAHLPFH
jgi:hypothetical protein